MILCNKEPHAKKNILPKTVIATDRFYVRILFSEVVQEEHIRLAWGVIELENKDIKDVLKTYKPELLSNGYTPGQLLDRNRCLLFKSKKKWTARRIERAEVLFDLYPPVEKAYKLYFRK